MKTGCLSLHRSETLTPAERQEFVHGLARTFGDRQEKGHGAG